MKLIKVEEEKLQELLANYQILLDKVRECEEEEPFALEVEELPESLKPVEEETEETEAETIESWQN